MTDKYTTFGVIRGRCGHIHFSFLDALRCRNRDRMQCDRGGITSDREVYWVNPDGALIDEHNLSARPFDGGIKNEFIY